MAASWCRMLANGSNPRCLLKIRRAREGSHQSPPSPSPSSTRLFARVLREYGSDWIDAGKSYSGRLAWERGQRARDAALPITFNYLTSGDAALSYGISRSTLNAAVLAFRSRYARGKLRPELQALRTITSGNGARHAMAGWGKRVRQQQSRWGLITTSFIIHHSLDFFLPKNSSLGIFPLRRTCLAELRCARCFCPRDFGLLRLARRNEHLGAAKCACR